MLYFLAIEFRKLLYSHVILALLIKVSWDSQQWNIGHVLLGFNICKSTVIYYARLKWAIIRILKRILEL